MERQAPDITADAAACPYCGEMNALKRTWCSVCERSLMIRGPARATRSPWVAILGALWIAGGVLGILGMVGVLILTLIGFATLKTTLGAKADVPFPYGMVAAALLGGLLSFGQIAVARALRDRQRWAYYIVGVVTLLNLAGAVFGAIAGAAILREALAAMNARELPPEAGPMLAAVTTSVGVSLLIGVGIHGLFTLLVALSWRDFFGPMERFMPEVQGQDDVQYFNFGLACKRRKMWFMAMRQWEAAAARAPRDPEYLYALGLAYVQLHWFEPARETLDRAMAVAPQDEAIRQSRGRIEALLAAQR
jgi:tetratricopeptide (TPR) repeat protein